MASASLAAVGALCSQGLCEGGAGDLSPDQAHILRGIRVRLRYQAAIHARRAASPGRCLCPRGSWLTSVEAEDGADDFASFPVVTDVLRGILSETLGEIVADRC